MKPVHRDAISPLKTKPLYVASDRGGCFSGKVTGNVLRGFGSSELMPVSEEIIDVGEDEVLEAEDVEPLRVLPTPILPSYAEIEKHRIDHWPPRTWCDECCEGFGREKPHFTKPEGGPRKAIVSFDYMFLKKNGEFGAADSDVEDGGIKILVVYDSKSRSVFGHVVPQKGIDPKRYAVDMIVEDILWLGYSEIVLKTDNEVAIVKLLKETLAACKVAGIEQVAEEHPPPYDSQSNGAAENAVKQLRGRLRTMVLCLEKRLGKRIRRSANCSPPRLQSQLQPPCAGLVSVHAFVFA